MSTQRSPEAPPIARAVLFDERDGSAVATKPAGPLPAVDPSATPKVCPACGLHYPAEFNVCPRDATELTETPIDAARDELIGRTLSQTYTIVRVIGEGGMGRVYEAQHTRIASKRFAVKMLHPELARLPDVIVRFQREAEAAAAIRSPHVVDVYDVDRSSDGRPFIVGELLEGKDFGTLLDEGGRMAVGPAVRIVRQICMALTAAHAKGVVHRDMKPENVFITGDLADPIAKVLDFGISKIDDAPGAALTKTGMIMGTPSYMAPEQARGDRIDHRIDVYAVGAILYAALTGQRPFDRGDPTATLTAVLTQDPPRPTSIEPSIPFGLEMVIQRAMAKRPEDRHATMADLAAELAMYDQSDAAALDALGAGTALRRSTPHARTTRSVDMARPLIVLLGVLAVAATGGSIVTLVAGLVRVARGPGENLTGAEAVFLLVGLTLALFTPLLLVIRHVRIAVWDNSVRAMSLAERLRGPVLGALCAYGTASLLVRVLETVVLRRSVGVAWPVWDVLLVVIAAVAGVGAYAVHAAENPTT